MSCIIKVRISVVWICLLLIFRYYRIHILIILIQICGGYLTFIIRRRVSVLIQKIDLSYNLNSETAWERKLIGIFNRKARDHRNVLCETWSYCLFVNVFFQTSAPRIFSDSLVSNNHACACVCSACVREERHFLDFILTLQTLVFALWLY